MLAAPQTGQSLPIKVNRSLEVRRIQRSVTYQRPQYKRPARIGDRLQFPGDGVLTGSRSSTILLIDANIGWVNVFENTDLQIKRLGETASGGQITLLFLKRGQARWQIRPFRHPDSRFELETPAGIAGVRGTDFGIAVEPSGKTNVATVQGAIYVSARGETVVVEEGFGSIIMPGEPPTPPQVFTNDVNLKIIGILRTSLGTVEWRGQVEPFNLVWVNDQPISIGIDGKFRVIAPLPTSQRVKLHVRSPLGKERFYTLQVP